MSDTQIRTGDYPDNCKYKNYSLWRSEISQKKDQHAIPKSGNITTMTKQWPSDEKVR